MGYIILNNLLSKKNIFIPYILGIMLYQIFFLKFGDLNLSILAIFIVTIKLTKAFCMESDVFNVDKYYLTLPYRKKDVVKEKYLLFLTIMAIGIIAFFIGILINIIFSGYSEVHLYNIALVLVILPIIIIFQSIYFFTYFKRGAAYTLSNSNKIYMLIFIAMMIYGQIRKRYNIKLSIPGIRFGEKESLVLIICISLLVFMISYFMSLRYYNKREL